MSRRRNRNRRYADPWMRVYADTLFLRHMLALIIIRCDRDQRATHQHEREELEYAVWRLKKNLSKLTTQRCA